MRSFAFSLFVSCTAARILHSLPEDPFAFPKYRVTFLNGLPLLNDTAERWLRDGLHGGELEFLDQPWRDISHPMREIGSGETGENESTLPSGYALEHMKASSNLSYLCLIPPSVEAPVHPPEDPPAEVTPVHSWSLLQPLDGTCIYHRQGWFTYAYCHNSHVRQFREMIHAHPLTPGHYEIEEDPDWEAYDLGRAPTPEPGADLTVAEQAAVAANLELATSSGSRYLVQRWGDGTVCDKTGKKREIEVQFHCSMTMTDTILLVKESKTCHYILVINTPRLCGEPGFKSRLDQREEALIRCREVVSPEALASADGGLPEADHPFKASHGGQRNPAPQPIDGAAADKNAAGADQTKAADDSRQSTAEVVRRVLERLLGQSNRPADDDTGIVVEEMDDGEVMIEFIPAEDGDAEDGEHGYDNAMVIEALRTAGFEVDSERKTEKGKPRPKGAAQGRRAAGQPGRDEL